MSIRSPSYRQIGQLAGHLATCLATGMPMEKSLETGASYLTSLPLQHAVRTAVEEVRAGNDLHSAFEPHKRVWPNFFLPMILIGEQSGRLEEALRYLERQCRLLDGPRQSLQQLWMVPLTILAVGALLELVVGLAFGSATAALWQFLRAVRGLIILGAGIYFLLASPFKPIVDQIRLGLPYIGQMERELALNQFFSALSMLYAVSGQRVEQMVRLASKCVSNVAVRIDLLRAAQAIEQGQSISEAFRVPRHLTNDEKNAIEAGDLSGTLEASFDRLAESAGEQFQVKLKLFHAVLIRVILGVVVLSLGGCVMRIVMSSQAR